MTLKPGTRLGVGDQADLPSAKPARRMTPFGPV